MAMIQGLYQTKQPKRLQARKGLGVGKGTPEQFKRQIRRYSNGSEAKKWMPATHKDRVRLKKVGRRGRRLRSERDPWRQRIFAIHGERCIYPGCNSTGPFDVMHAYSKGAYPEWHTADFNGFIGCRFHHTGAGADSFEFDPHLKQALMECADEMRASMRPKEENPRLQPSWEELQDIITRAINMAEQGRRRG